MDVLKISQEKATEEAAEALIKLCPFGAISRKDGKLEISAACRMCRMCVRKGPAGVITLESVEDRRPKVDKEEWKGIAVFVEHRDGEIHNVTKELLGKARELTKVTGQPVYALMIGSGIKKSAESLLKYGADKVFTYDYPELKDFLMEPYANAFEDFIRKEKPSAILVGATNIGRSLAPRVASRMRTGLTADCTKLLMKENTDLVQIRPAFGGNIMAQIITTNNRPQFCTVRYKIFEQAKPVEHPSGEIVPMELPEEKRRSSVKLLKIEEKPKEMDISEAGVIVAVGRGLKSPADIELAKKLADALGAQLACTRPMVEKGWFDPKKQIGLSGRTVNAKLIVTLGVSGSVQFAAGMRNSECIVSVNSDPEAPIFNIAHYCLCGDLYEIVPKLIEKIREGAENAV